MRARPQLILTACIGAGGLMLLGFLLLVMLLSKGEDAPPPWPQTTVAASAASSVRPKLRDAKRARPRTHLAAKLAPATQTTLDTTTLKRLTRLGLPVYCGSPRRRMVALSFDDGPGLDTLYLLKLLRDAHAGATFFSVGGVAHEKPVQLREQARQDEIGDHTWTHPMLSELDAAQQHSQLFDTRALLRKLSGQHVWLFRPPYGDHDAAVDKMVANAGMVEVMWSLDTSDWKATAVSQIVDAVRANVRPGAIILMHDIHPLTIAAVPQILQLLAARHLQAVGVSQLLSEDPPTLGQLRQGEPACFGS